MSVRTYGGRVLQALPKGDRIACIAPSGTGRPRIRVAKFTYKARVIESALWPLPDHTDRWCEHHEAQGSCPVYGCAHHSKDGQSTEQEPA